MQALFTATIGDGRASALPRTAPGRGANSVATLLAVEHVLLDAEATTRERIFASVAKLIGARSGLREAAIVAALSEREELGSTALGQGVALPHARLKGLTYPIAAFVRLKWAMPFDAPDGNPVSSILVLLVPERATDEHLELLAEAASMFCDKAFRERLSDCLAPTETVAAFARWPAA